jgi:hypothetical protein
VITNLQNAPCLAIILAEKKFAGKIPATNQVKTKRTSKSGSGSNSKAAAAAAANDLVRSNHHP